MSITRRAFVRNGALALVGTAAVPGFLQRSVLAQATTAASRQKRLVVIFQRGAADGLNIVIPYREQAYYSMRPTIAIPQNQIVDLDGFFGLHPAMAPLKTLWEQKHLAIVHAAGSPDTTRSHFDAQDYMESGTPGVKATQDGWLNRALQAEDEHRHSGVTPFRAVALGTQVPRTLGGRIQAVALSNLNDFSVGGKSAIAQPLSNTFEAMYDQSSDSVLHGTGTETFEAVKMLKAADPAKYQPAAGVEYPRGQFGDALKQTAQLLKANLGVEAAFCDVGGWDTHQNQGGAEGQLANRLREFSGAIAAFWRDMGDQGGDVVMVTMSEFGRTAHQNGTAGTDHGHANAMLVIGGGVRGGRVYGQWPGLAPEQLNEGRDLRVTTDFRQVLAEASYKQLGARDLRLTFPGSNVTQSQFLNLMG